MRGFPECTTPFPAAAAALYSLLCLPHWKGRAERFLGLTSYFRLRKVGVASSWPRQAMGTGWPAAGQLTCSALSGRVGHRVQPASCSPTNGLHLSVCVKTSQAKDKTVLYFLSHLPNLGKLLANPLPYKPGQQKDLGARPSVLHWILTPFLLGGKLASVWLRVPRSSSHRGPIVLTP